MTKESEVTECVCTCTVSQEMMIDAAAFYVSHLIMLTPNCGVKS